MKIRFRSINAIEEFLDIVNRFSAEIDIKSKRTTVDGKSMMGIFSLDLSQTSFNQLFTDITAFFVQNFVMDKNYV